MIKSLLHFLALTLALLLLASAPWPSFIALAQSSGLPGPAASAPPSAGTALSIQPSASASAVVSSASLGTDENYRLGSGDKMQVTVYGEDDMSGQFSVDGSGEVQLPLIGRIAAAGKTVHEFVNELSDALSSKYLRDPKVSVQIINYRPFYIMGEVNKPGEYPYEHNLDVLTAVVLAGGYTYRANDSKIMVRRNGAPSEQEFPATSQTKIYPGDILRVRERIF